MLCPPCTHSIHIFIKFEHFICLKSIRNKFIPLGNNLFGTKLKYLQRGSGCCKKKGKKVDKINMMKNPPTSIFFTLKESILIRNYPRNTKKMVPMLYNNDFWRKLVVFVEKRLNESEAAIFYPHF